MSEEFNRLFNLYEALVLRLDYLEYCRRQHFAAFIDYYIQRARP